MLQGRKSRLGEMPSPCQDPLCGQQMGGAMKDLVWRRALASSGLPMLRRKRHSGAAHVVVEPCVLSRGRGEEAFEVEHGGDAGNEVARSVEQSEKTIPIDGEEKRVIGSKECSSRGERNGAVAEAGDGQRNDGVGVGEFGNVDELGCAREREGAEKVRAKQRFEAAFNRHPDGLRLKETLKGPGSGRVGEVVRQRADGSEQGLIDARAGGEACKRRDFRPRLFCSLFQDLRIGGILTSSVPCQRIRNSDEGM